MGDVKCYFLILEDFLAGDFGLVAGIAAEGGAVKKEADGMRMGP